jgi:hypothetical protein
MFRAFVIVIIHYYHKASDLVSLSNCFHGAVSNLEMWQFLSSCLYYPLLWNLKFRYCVRKSLHLNSILSQLQPVHICRPRFSNIHFNINFTSTPLSSNCKERLNFE